MTDYNTTLVNSRTGETVEFDNVRFVLNRLDTGRISAEHFTVRGAGQIGEYRAASRMGSREIALDGYILADDSPGLLSLKRRLARVTNPLDRFELKKMTGGGVHRLLCSAKGGASFERSPEFSGNAVKFTLEAVCHNPLWLAEEEAEDGWDNYTGTFILPMAVTSGGVTLGERQTSGSIYVTNGGDVETGVVITAKSAVDIEYLRVENAVTHEFIAVNGASEAGVIAAEEVVIIDTRYGEKSVTARKNGVTSDIMRRVDADSTFFSLAPGENIFTCETNLTESDGDDLRLTFTFSPMYLFG